MKKAMMIAVAAGAAMLTGSVIMNGPTGLSPHSDVVEARAAPKVPAPQQLPPKAPAETKAIREQRASGRVRYWRGAPAAIKNRGAGERAHRRWRKTKASGRQAA